MPATRSQNTVPVFCLVVCKPLRLSTRRKHLRGWHLRSFHRALLAIGWATYSGHLISFGDLMIGMLGNGRMAEAKNGDEQAKQRANKLHREIPQRGLKAMILPRPDHSAEAAAES